MASAASMYVKLQKLTNQANKDEMAFNKQEAATARDWQKMMSDTSHQREVKDLQAAGLNPVLASNNGAQSYTTSSASANVESAAGAVSSAYGAVTSAGATRYAADRAYASSLAQANATIEAARLHKESVQYQTDHSKSGSIFGILDNYANKAASLVTGKISYSQTSAISNKAKNLISSNSVLKNAFKNRSSISISSYRSIAKSIRSSVDSQLRLYGVNRITEQVRYDYVRYLLTGNKSFIASFKYLT